MKKQILLVAIAVLSVFAVKAGDKDLMFRGGGGGDSKLTIGVSVGAGIPMSDFGKKDTTGQNDTTKRTGWASTGFHFNVTAGYLLGGPVGVMVMIGGNMNSFDVTSYETATGFNNNVPSGETKTLTSTNYYIGQYLVGPFLSLPASDKLKIDIRLLVGLVTGNTPTQTESETAGSSNETIVTSGKDGSGFGYHFGAGIKYNFSDKMGLTVNAGYTGSSIAYTGYTDTESGVFSGTHTNTTLKQTMATSIVSVTVGLAFNL